MNPDDLIISTDYSGVTVSVDDYWNEMTDPRDEDQDAFKSINDRLKTIENRLGILIPDPKMLEQYEVLQDMYKQYKAAETLLTGPDSEAV
jgi:hypothetical protein|tara:strand:- start:221 stop:490 length:270 start_codon:yes stop_codon:yes gene_type:complete